MLADMIAALSKLVCEARLISAFQQTGAERFMNLDRRSYDVAGYVVE